MLDARLPYRTQRQVCSVPSVFLEHLELLQEQGAAKSLLVHLSQPASVEKLVAASGGYDLPSFEKLTTLKTWAEEGPPKGTLYHYPNPYKHQIYRSPPRRRRRRSPTDLYAGHPDEDMPAIPSGRGDGKTLAWAEGECEATCGADGDFAAMARSPVCEAIAASIRNAAVAATRIRRRRNAGSS